MATVSLHWLIIYNLVTYLGAAFEDIKYQMEWHMVLPPSLIHKIKMSAARPVRSTAGQRPTPLFGDDDSASAPRAAPKRKEAPAVGPLVATDGATAADGSVAAPPPRKKPKRSRKDANSTPGLCNLLGWRIFVLSA